MAILLQVALVLMGWFLPGEALPVALPAAMLAISVASNVGLQTLAARQRLTERMATAALVLDVCVVTALLVMSQGASNPFTALYLVSVTIAASVLSARDTVVVVLLSIAAYSALFFVGGGGGGEHAHHGGGDAMNAHLFGMWVAYAVSAPFVAYAIRVLRNALDTARRRTAATERIASLGTLAAGAAHELSTPLGTIALAADGLAQRFDDDDVRLIQGQVARSHEILRRLAADAGHPSGPPPESIRLDHLVARVVAGLDPDLDVVWELNGHTALRLCVAKEPTIRAIRGLIDNGLDASPDGEPVRLVAQVTDDVVCLDIVDRGAGIAPEHLERVGEPFFTTKGHDGMGLGVFFARTVLEQHGGRLTYDAGPEGLGTIAHVELPRCDEDRAER
jgi:two-component system sensor histidine kinase RegB